MSTYMLLVIKPDGLCLTPTSLLCGARGVTDPNLVELRFCVYTNYVLDNSPIKSLLRAYSSPGYSIYNITSITVYRTMQCIFKIEIGNSQETKNYLRWMSYF